MAGDARSADAPLATPQFDYDEAFKRNLGWITDVEQQRLRLKRVAIGGVGGVGGFHLLTLARLGVGKFTIADYDVFELANFNRQVGATSDTLGRTKIGVMAEMARAINPELDIRLFENGIDEANADAFLDGVDLYIDGLDFFVLDLREKLFARCVERRIPIIIAGPIGMGSGYLIFMPDRMTPAQWFRFAGLDQQRKRIHFLLGLTPRMWHQRYLVDRSRVDLKNERGPSTVMSCQLCASVAGIEALKILIGRGKVWAVPHYHHVDPFLGRYARGWLPGGNANPLQRLKIALVSRLMRRLSAAPRPETSRPALKPIETVLDQARWAPSGDNSQPWRFAILGELKVQVTVPAGADGNVYQYNEGEPHLIALGTCLESMRIAATAFGWRMEWQYTGVSYGRHVANVAFVPDAAVQRDDLIRFLPVRSVDRRPYPTTRLSQAEKTELEAAWGSGFKVQWFESTKERLRITRVISSATEIRLRIPEAYRVHQATLDWDDAFSSTGLPVGALGLSPLTVRIMRWAMRSWTRIDRLNRYALGTWLARWEMDWRPGFGCAAYVAVFPASHPTTTTDAAPVAISTGQALQRFWLTATRLGLAVQPAFAPLIFADHASRGIAFTADEKTRRSAANLATKLSALFGGKRPIFLGRIGRPLSRAPSARSLRLSLSALITKEAAPPDDLPTDD
jgi:nitroreductase